MSGGTINMGTTDANGETIEFYVNSSVSNHNVIGGKVVFNMNRSGKYNKYSKYQSLGYRDQQ